MNIEIENDIIENYGILASISWNSKKWANDPTKLDLKKSNYGEINENTIMHESLTFGHQLYPLEEGGYYIGYTPMLRKGKAPSVEKTKEIKIIFLFSSDYGHLNENKPIKKILGFYGFPEIGAFTREAKHELYLKYETTNEKGNIKALAENIIFFDKHIEINNSNVISKKYLPYKKEISGQGFNYLNSDNVFNLITEAIRINPKNLKLKKFANQLPYLKFDIDELEIPEENESELENLDIENESLQDIDFSELEKITIDSSKKISELERKMRNQLPEVKYRISKYIERGIIATEIKKHSGFICSICEELGENEYSFLKENGERYIETHHVEPVSSGGSLGSENLITVCANHHRQLHYGNAKVIENTKNYFTFKIDGKEITIAKFNNLICENL